MKIVIHIGTHKTGTSSLQSFCSDNREALLRHGVLYPKLPNRSKSFNFLAAHLAFGRLDETRRFFDKAIQTAQRANVETILVIGESFYAMTAFFYRLYERPCGDYWEREEQCVAALRTCLSNNVDFAFYGYVRRQNHFLESLYNQCVKHWPGFDGDIEDFLQRMNETMDYSRHIEIWENVFGIEAVHICSYEPVSDVLFEHFMKWALNIERSSDFVILGERVNERLSRDLLEYKRIFNRKRMSRADGITAMVQIIELARIMGDDGNYHDYLSPDAREILLNRVNSGNAKLCKRYPEAGFLMQNSRDSGRRERIPYPGLSVEAALEIASRHIYLSLEPKQRLRAMLRRAYYQVRNKNSWADYFLGRVRHLFRI